MKKLLLSLLIISSIAKLGAVPRSTHHQHSIERKNQYNSQNNRRINARDMKKPLFRGGEIPRVRQSRGPTSQGR